MLFIVLKSVSLEKNPSWFRDAKHGMFTFICTRLQQMLLRFQLSSDRLETLSWEFSLKMHLYREY